MDAPAGTQADAFAPALADPACRPRPLANDAASLVLAVVGLSFLWPCLGSSATMHFRHAMANSASLITTDWHAVIMGILYLIAIVLCLGARRSLNRLLASPRLGPVALGLGIGGIVGHVLLVGSPLMGSSTPLVTAVVLLGFVLSIAFIVGHILAWGTLLARMPIGRAIFVIGASNALSYALQLGIDVAFGTGLLAYLVICPIPSGLALFVLSRRTGASEMGEDGSAESARSGSPADSAGLGLRGLPWKLIVPIVVLIYLEQILTSLLFQRYTDWPRDNLTITLAVGCAIWLVASAYLWRAGGLGTAKRARGRGAQREAKEASLPDVASAPCRADAPASGANGPEGTDTPSRTGTSDAALATLFAGLAVIYMAALLVTIVLPALTGPFTERLLVAAGSSLRVLLWITIACAVDAGRTRPLPGYLVYVLFVLAIPVSRLASLAFSRTSPEVIAALVAPGTIVPIVGVVLFLMAATFVVLNARDTRRRLNAGQGVIGASGAGGTGPGGNGGFGDAAGPGGTAGADGAAGGRDGQGARLAQVAQEAGLSARETEVLGLICLGYSARHAGQKMGISESTVVSHVTHIYRKLGVSSKQELIALVNEDR